MVNWKIQKSVKSTMQQHEDQICGLFNHIFCLPTVCVSLLHFCQWERVE